MIKLNPYSSEFEEAYWEVVNEKVIDDVQKKILSSCVKFLPNDFFASNNPEFKEIVLAPFHKLKAAQKYIEDNYQNGIKNMESECFDFNPANTNPGNINNLYKEVYDAFVKVADAQRDKTSMRVRIVKEADITVCPYCNRDYINCRDGDVAGAQLDHFFSRTKYPIFAVSLYNFVPACANCNRIKNDSTEKFASPFDEDIDWDNDIYFEFHPKESDDFEIKIKAKLRKAETTAIQNNITKMRIEEAYQIHSLELKELQEKELAYSKSQKEEFKEILKKKRISNKKIKRIVFGPKITSEDMRKKPLGKMISDWHKKSRIYPK